MTKIEYLLAQRLHFTLIRGKIKRSLKLREINWKDLIKTIQDPAHDHDLHDAEAQFSSFVCVKPVLHICGIKKIREDCSPFVNRSPDVIGLRVSDTKDD